MSTLPTDIILGEILPKLPNKYTFRFKCVSKSYKTLISTTVFIDILFNNILHRLPVKSLIRFKCVSKSFKAKISSPEFINLHFRYSLSSYTNRLIILNLLNNGNSQSALHYFNLDFLEKPALYRLILPESFNKDSVNIQCFGFCNGLLCIGSNFMWRNSFERFLLINPSIGTSFSVPPPLNHASKNHMLGVRSINIIGFGYDSLTNDYKIVEIVEYDFFGLRIRDTLVYSLMSNSWKVVESTSPPKATLKYSEAGALIKNHLLHWLFPSFSRRITCFDLRKEKWVQNVPFPDDDVPVYGHFEDDKQDNLVHLGVFEGCLCLIIEVVSCLNTVTVWVMKEYGVKESWVKLLGVSDPPCTVALHTYPLCYRDGSRDEVLLGIGGECGLFFKIRWYKAKDKLSRITEIQTIHEVNHKRILEVYLCNGSLVTIPGSIQIKTRKAESPRQKKGQD